MTKEKFNDFILKAGPVALFSALTGVLGGTLVVFYNYVADVILHDSLLIYSIFSKRPVFIPLLFVVLIIFAFLSFVVLKFLPKAKGTIIPRVHPANADVSWWQTILAKIFGSYISFFGGLSLGVEGPATAIGSSVGTGLSKLIRSRRLSAKDSSEISRLVSLSGTTSALTSIFNAPLSGIAFVIEELEHKLSLLLVVALTFSATTSLFTSYALRKLLELPERILPLSLASIPAHYFWMLLLSGIALGILGILFSKLLRTFSEPKFLKKIPVIVKLIVVFLITGTVGILLTNMLGGGMFAIRELLTINFPWWILLIMLVVKSLLTALALSSKSHGGLLMPTMAIGAIAGALIGKAFISAGLPEEYYSLFIVSGAVAFFGATYRTPITAILLAIELMGSVTGLVSVGLEVIIAFVTAELILKIPYAKIWNKINIKRQIGES